MSISPVTAVPTTPIATADARGGSVTALADATAAKALAAANAALAEVAPEPVTLDGTNYVLYGPSGFEIQSYGAVALFSRAAYLHAGMWVDEDDRPAILPVDPVVHLSLVA